MNEFKISCNISPNGEKPLGLSISVDDRVYFDTDSLVQSENIEIYFPEDDNNHELKFTLKGKTSNHTKIDSEGNILNDNFIVISNLEFDDINVDQILYSLSDYHHNFNNNGEFVNSRFFGTMGCNGTVTLKFTTPIYLWLLENM